MNYKKYFGYKVFENLIFNLEYLVFGLILQGHCSEAHIFFAKSFRDKSKKKYMKKMELLYMYYLTRNLTQDKTNLFQR